MVQARRRSRDIANGNQQRGECSSSQRLRVPPLLPSPKKNGGFISSLISNRAFNKPNGRHSAADGGSGCLQQRFMASGPQLFLWNRCCTYPAEPQCPYKRGSPHHVAAHSAGRRALWPTEHGFPLNLACDCQQTN